MKAIATTIAAALLLSAASAATAHEGQFSAGQPGNAKQPARTVKVIMKEDGKKMLFEPADITVRKGEQIRFVLENDGSMDHEFMLATVADNQKHAEVMRKYPKMEHADPNAKRLTPFTNGELVWKFTKVGTFEYACLIPGHREAGMHGTITVK